MTPMPEEAEPIAKIIARDVPRPRDLPTMMPRNDNDLEGAARSLGWKPEARSEAREGTCPLGLRPFANDARPASWRGAEIAHNDPLAPACTLVPGGDYEDDPCYAPLTMGACEVQQAVEAFTEWWDNLSEIDAQEAVTAIWGMPR